MRATISIRFNRLKALEFRSVKIKTSTNARALYPKEENDRCSHDSLFRSAGWPSAFGTSETAGFDSRGRFLTGRRATLASQPVLLSALLRAPHWTPPSAKAHPRVHPLCHHAPPSAWPSRLGLRPNQAQSQGVD